MARRPDWFDRAVSGDEAEASLVDPDATTDPDEGADADTATATQPRPSVWRRAVRWVFGLPQVQQVAGSSQVGWFRQRYTRLQPLERRPRYGEVALKLVLNLVAVLLIVLIVGWLAVGVFHVRLQPSLWGGVLPFTLVLMVTAMVAGGLVVLMVGRGLTEGLPRLLLLGVILLALFLLGLLFAWWAALILACFWLAWEAAWRVAVRQRVLDSNNESPPSLAVIWLIRLLMVLLAAVAGVMVFTALDDLKPTAKFGADKFCNGAQADACASEKKQQVDEDLTELKDEIARCNLLSQQGRADEFRTCAVSANQKADEARREVAAYCQFVATHRKHLTKKACEPDYRQPLPDPYPNVPK